MTCTLNDLGVHLSGQDQIVHARDLLETKMNSKYFMILFTVCSMSALTGFAQTLEEWTPSRLTDEADLVVIAKPFGTVSHGKIIELNEMQMTESSLSFEVKAIFKGKADESIDVVYFLPKKRGGFREAKFRTTRLVIENKSAMRNIELAPPTYLLYLHRIKGKKKYKLVTGSTSPKTSVRELIAPLSVD